MKIAVVRGGSRLPNLWLLIVPLKTAKVVNRQFSEDAPIVGMVCRSLASPWSGTRRRIKNWCPGTASLAECHIGHGAKVFGRSCCGVALLKVQNVPAYSDLAIDGPINLIWLGLQ